MSLREMEEPLARLVAGQIAAIVDYYCDSPLDSRNRIEDALMERLPHVERRALVYALQSIYVARSMQGSKPVREP